ncbi:hypothetical protein [Photobacterium piscicola]|uniref:hypothetical protein n=1 Tax=Photobacterium piscicola TaxID=1378299 RepID=UPI002E179512|nr:hypothetical protein [Photobacterium piscicola]
MANPKQFRATSRLQTMIGKLTLKEKLSIDMVVYMVDRYPHITVGDYCRLMCGDFLLAWNTLHRTELNQLFND